MTQNRRWTWAPAALGGLALACLFAGGWQIREHQAAEAHIAAAAPAVAGMPEALPDAPDPAQDLFRAVRIDGTLAGDPILQPIDHPQMGPGFRVIQPIEVAGRRILIDRGFIYEAWRNDPLTATTIEANGNLDWPDDLAVVARQAGAAPVLVVATTPTGDGIVPVPVDPAAARDPHWRNALIGFALAALLTGMTVLSQWRIKRRDEGNVTQ
ncbi:SURF1 family cytochrome oxidase biogenesis protein [Falsirhodobacter sp. 1013]|uniref:SURF1 family cytochrome oxidase biogenesis protein n=1 Tax=Falsirhodobacter sp. 1013 TaxID=3417566 RepID=UPI003EB7E8AB